MGMRSIGIDPDSDKNTPAGVGAGSEVRAFAFKFLFCLAFSCIGPASRATNLGPGGKDFK